MRYPRTIKATRTLGITQLNYKNNASIMENEVSIGDCEHEGEEAKMPDRITLSESCCLSIDGSWSTAELVCQIQSNRLINLSACAWAEGAPSHEVDSDYSYTEENIDTPSKFVESLVASGIIDHYDWSITQEILPNLFPHLPLFAAIAGAHYDYFSDDIFSEAFELWLLASDIEVPRIYDEALILIEEIYRYAQKYNCSHSTLPTGSHLINDTEICFTTMPAVAEKLLIQFNVEQALKKKISDHISKAQWKRFDPAQAKSSFERRNAYERNRANYEMVNKFCHVYLSATGSLPSGKFCIDNLTVEFSGFDAGCSTKHVVDRYENEQVTVLNELQRIHPENNTIPPDISMGLDVDD